MSRAGRDASLGKLLLLGFPIGGNPNLAPSKGYNLLHVPADFPDLHARPSA